MHGRAESLCQRPTCLLTRCAWPKPSTTNMARTSVEKNSTHDALEIVYIIVDVRKVSGEMKLHKAYHSLTSPKTIYWDSAISPVPCVNWWRRGLNAGRSRITGCANPHWVTTLKQCVIGVIHVFKALPSIKWTNRIVMLKKWQKHHRFVTRKAALLSNRRRSSFIPYFFFTFFLNSVIIKTFVPCLVVSIVLFTFYLLSLRPLKSSNKTINLMSVAVKSLKVRLIQKTYHVLKIFSRLRLKLQT